VPRREVEVLNCREGQALHTLVELWLFFFTFGFGRSAAAEAILRFAEAKLGLG
jgi:hypothetical protein